MHFGFEHLLSEFLIGGASKIARLKSWAFREKFAHPCKGGCPIDHTSTRQSQTVSLNFRGDGGIFE